MKDLLGAVQVTVGLFGCASWKRLLLAWFVFSDSIPSLTADGRDVMARNIFRKMRRCATALIVLPVR